jgi:anti-sigma regulatory factor (Ser/Thr protein kinase)
MIPACQRANSGSSHFTMKKEFKRELKSIEQIFGFISVFLEKYKLDDSISFTLNLVIEELFTNMIKYNTESTSEILIELDKKEGNMIVTITDYDVEPFDVTRKKEVDVKAHLQDRRVGGLGIHLVKNMVDKIDYEYKNRESRITLTKRLER